jgi:hypothetical protein
MNKKQAQRPLSAEEATLWAQFAQEAHPSWSLFPRKDENSTLHPESPSVDANFTARVDSPFCSV